MNINATLIGQSVAFFIFVWFCMRYVWPPIINALHERQKKIAEGLDAANRATHDLLLAHEQVAAQLREAKTQAAEIIKQAKKSAQIMIEEARDQAQVEAEHVKAQATTEIDQQLSGLKEALRAQLSHLTIAGAEKILGASIDAKLHTHLVDKLATEI